MNINDEREVEVVNRWNGTVGYSIPDLGIGFHRSFAPGEVKSIPFKELYMLTNVTGGEKILKDYLVIKDYQVAKELLPNVEPEYYYSENDIRNVILNGSLDAFLDMLDFAPDGVIDIVKQIAVDLPLNDNAKRKALQDKTGFDIDKAIMIKNTKYDGDPQASDEENNETLHRRVAVVSPEKKRRVIVQEEKK